MSAFEALTEGLLKLYYPVRELRGALKPPSSSPNSQSSPRGGRTADPVYIVVCNHPNGLLDPLLVRVLLRRRVGFLGKSTFWGNPLGRWAMRSSGALPVYRAHEADTSKNEETFQRCRELLQRGEWLALFPEGKSHSEPTLQALKTGAARIALSTLTQAPSLPLRILPVGLFYEDKAVFRSRAVGTIGEPVEVADLLDAYRDDARVGVDRLTERIERALGAVVLQGETEELRRGFYAVAGWTQPRVGTAGSAPAPGELALREERARALARRWAAGSEEERGAAVAAFQQFERRLIELGIGDPLAVLDTDPRKVLARTAGLVALAPIAAVGVVLGWLPYRTVRPIAARMARGNHDVEATMKVLLGLVVMTAHYGLLALVAGVALGPAWGLGLLMLGPLSGYMALRFEERWALRVEALRGLWRARDADVREAVARERAVLIAAVG
jgi:1-acyl-sn-glycerol-3-phosphate acyltransferase